MPAFYQTTLQAIPASALLFLLLAVVANVLRLSHGHLHPTQLPLLTIALFGIGGSLAMLPDPDRSIRHPERWLASIGLLFAVALAINNQTIYAQDNHSHRLLNAGLWLQAILALYLWVGMMFSNPEARQDPLWKHIATLALVLWPLLLEGVVLASPQPNIDVFHHGIEAVNHLLNGKNPYSESLSDIYHGAYGYVPGYIYLPMVLLTNAMALIFLGDIRQTYIIAQIVILIILWRLARDRGFSPLAARLFPLVWIAFPVTLFVLEQAWNDTLLIAFCALLAWSLNRQTQSPGWWKYTGLFLGLALGSKQYALVVAWLTAIYVWRRFGMAVAFRVLLLAGGVLFLTLFPFLFQNPQAFIDHTVLEIAGYGIRSDALSWLGFFMAVGKVATPGSQVLTIYLLLAITVSLWFLGQPRMTLFHWALANLLIYAGLFLFGKQAFCNYYYFLALFIILSLLFTQNFPLDAAPFPPVHPLPRESAATSTTVPPPLFWSLLALAVALRIAFPGTIEFKEDEANAIAQAFQHLSQGSLPMVGLKSPAGLFTPPFFIDLVALPVYWTTDPVKVTFFISFLNLVGLWLLHRLVQRQFSNTIAMITTLLLASSPWAILYSRTIGAQDCLFPFMIALATVLLSLSEHYRPWKVWLTGGGLALVTQLHVSAWLLPPAMALFMIRYRIALRWRDVAIGIALFVLLYAPYLIFHQQNHWQNLLESLQIMRDSQGPTLTLGNLFWMFFLATGLGYNYILGNEGFNHFWSSYWIAVPQTVFLLFFLVVVLSLVWTLVHHWPLRPMSLARNRQATPQQKTVALFLIQMVIIQGGYWALSISVHPHYGIIVFPTLFLFAALFLDAVSTRMPVRHRRWTLVTLMTILVAANLYFTLTFESFILYRHQDITGDYGVPYFVDQSKWQNHLPSWERAGYR
ncbi:MAG: hypothetical protein HQL73_12020 [Magnetococcales bacterium]|nr:hypothetical protein [Magnetococcales bacterium]